MLWTSAASAWRTPEKVWLRSAGTSVSSSPAGCGARPRATRDSWTSSRACLTAASAVRSASRRWSNSSREIALRAEECVGPREVGPARVEGRLLAPQGRDPGPEQRDLCRRHPRSPSGASTAGSGPGPGCPGPGPGGLHVGLGVDHGRLLDVDLDLVRLLVELDQQSPFFTRSLSSTRTRLTWPATRGAT